MCSKLSAPLDVEAVEDAEQDQAGEPLGGRRGIVERAAGQAQRQRLAPVRVVGLEVRARAAGLDAVHVGGEFVADVAAIEVVEPGAPEVLQRRGELLRAARRAGGRDLAVDEEGVRETGGLLGGFELQRCRARGGRRLGIALAPEPHRVAEQVMQRQLAAEVLREIVGERPAADGAGDRDGGERAARRDRVVAELPIAFAGGAGAGRPAGFDVSDAAARLVDQPEAVAADGVHVGVDDGDRGGHADHRLDGVAAGGEDGAAGLGGRRVRGGDGGAIEEVALDHGSVMGIAPSRDGPPTSSRRRRCRSAGSGRRRWSGR